MGGALKRAMAGPQGRFTLNEVRNTIDTAIAWIKGGLTASPEGEDFNQIFEHLSGLVVRLLTLRASKAKFTTGRIGTRRKRMSRRTSS